MRRLTSLLAAATLMIGAAPTAAVAISDQSVVRSLTKHQTSLGNASSAMVVDLSTRKTIYAFHAKRTLAPASNEKLFITAAALLKFGPKATLDTTVVAPPGATLDRKGQLRGNLYLVGAGDPSLADAGLAKLAKQVRRKGVRRISGAIIADESLLDRRRGGPDSGYRLDSYLGGALGGLVWRHGMLQSGSPAIAAARRFGQKLKASGVRYAKAPRLGTLPRSGPGGGASAEIIPVASNPSPSIQALVNTTNVFSENYYAEMLIKVLGARFGKSGSTQSGAAAVTAALSPFSIKPRIVDGSGLSRRDRTSSLTMVTLLTGMHASDVADEFRRSLPIAGLSGTLSSRMRGTPAAGRCRAKTGTLNGVSALSGYCLTRGGRNIAFSLIENGVNSYAAKSVEDRMVATIAKLD